MRDLERLEMEIDLRILNIWVEMNCDALEPEVLPLVAALCRAAYGKGYSDALSEPVRGQLCEMFNYPVPTRGER